MRRRASRLRRLWLVQPLLEVGLGAGECRLDQLFAAILQRDVQAAVGGQRRDVAAHDAGADHVHVPNSTLLRLPPKPLRRSCSRNTRTRLREVGEHMSSLIERASAS